MNGRMLNSKLKFELGEASASKHLADHTCRQGRGANQVSTYPPLARALQISFSLDTVRNRNTLQHDTPTQQLFSPAKEHCALSSSRSDFERKPSADGEPQFANVTTVGVFSPYAAVVSQLRIQAALSSWSLAALFPSPFHLSRWQPTT